jgi:hypothetical protein
MPAAHDILREKDDAKDLLFRFVRYPNNAMKIPACRLIIKTSL